MKTIDIIIPIFNEEETLEFLYERLKSVLDEIKNYTFHIIFVNDGSKDNSLKIIKELVVNDNRISYIDFSRNFGKEIAIIAGIDYSVGDAAIFMDADLQDPPELIPEMIKYWEKGYDDIYARRRSRKGETFFKKITSKLYYVILQNLTNVEIQKDTGDFRLLDKRCINVLKKLRESQRCSKSMFSWIGYNKKEVLYDREQRIAGKTKWNYKKLVDLAIDRYNIFYNITIKSINFYKFIYLFNFNIIYNF